MKSLEQIIEDYPEEQFLKADGFDDCILGVEDTSMKLIYSVTACIEKLAKDMEYQDAAEYFTFNVAGSYMGIQTPIWCYD